MTPRRHHRRNGLTTMMAVFTFTILFIAAVFSYSVFSTRDSFIELRNASHAASLAGAGTLAHDDLLTNDPVRAQARVGAARLAATQVAEVNQIKGLFLSMDPQNPTNDPAGNMVFGTLDKELGGTFTPLNLGGPFPADTARINAVRLEVTHPKRTGLKVKMYAHVDHNIIGFKPTNNLNAPVIPIALFSDTSAIPSPNSYEAATLVAADNSQFNYTTKVFNAAPGTDGIPEVKFEYGVPSGDPTVISVRNLNIGATVWADAQSQVASGITVSNVARVRPGPDSRGVCGVFRTGLQAEPGDPAGVPALFRHRRPRQRERDWIRGRTDRFRRYQCDRPRDCDDPTDADFHAVGRDPEQLPGSGRSACVQPYHRQTSAGRHRDGSPVTTTPHDGRDSECRA
jgi:hypothetical protein